jgi:hypothetical protein
MLDWWSARVWSLLSSRRWWLVPTLSFAALTVLVFSFYADVLFYRYDGTFILTLATAQKKWMAVEPGFSLNFLQGLGDIWIPTATQLIPGFVIGTWLAGDIWMPVIACSIFALEFFLPTLILLRCVGASHALSWSAALVGALFTLPYFIPTLAAWRIWGNPHFMPAIAANSLALCAFLAIGRSRSKFDLALVVAILALLSYLFVSQPVRAIIAAPMLAFFGTAALFGADSAAERLRKVVAAVAIAAILAIAFGAYIFALFYFARTTFFWADIAAFPVDWRQQSFVLSESAARGPYIWLACIAGAGLAAWREHGRLRLFALCYLVFIGVQQAVLLTAQLGGVKWGGPPTAYIDMFVLPFYALFGTYLLVGWWIGDPRRARRAMLALLLLPWGVVFALHRPYANVTFHQQNPFPWPPRETSMTRLLRSEIGLNEGQPFRGRVANIAGTEFESHYAWVPLVSQHNYDGAIAYNTGNDHRYYGLWYFDIPTLIADNQFSSPFLHVVNSRLLSDPSQKHVRQLTTITRFEPRLLASLGVRFVITGRPLPNHTPYHRLAVIPEHPDQWTLYLYELPDANVAGRWAVNPEKVETTRQAMLRMIDPAGEYDAAVYESLPKQLVVGSSSRIRVFRDRLVIEAESPGTSLLVLPVEFSHCFDVNVSGPAHARYLRANINQGAFLFSGSLRAEMRYRYAPWHFSCRFRDIEDARRLKIAEVGWPP